MRKKASGLLACSGATMMAPALSLTQGHHVFAWSLIAVQCSLLGGAIALLRRARRAGASSVCL